MRTSNEIDKLAPALAKAQGRLTNPPRNLVAKVKGRSKGGADYSYEYKYTSLDTILNMVRPIFAEEGLFVTQAVVGVNAPFNLVTRITHTSGQWIEGDTPLPYSGSSDPQELGVALTYTRRYGIAPFLNIAPEEDLDGKGAKPPPTGDDARLSGWRKRIAECGSLGALQAIWKEMTPQVRNELAQEKEEAKARIIEADTVAGGDK